jgi:CubicO group peptidase (beta-lactamase class C family)
MVRIALFAAALMLLLARGAGAADWSPQKAAEIERMVERFLKHQGDAVPAMSVAVGVDGELRLAKGFGSPARGGRSVPGRSITSVR